MITTIPLLLFLSIGTVSDIRKRKIPVILLAISGVFGIMTGFLTDRLSACYATDWLAVIFLGTVFIGISFLSEGKLGLGDALAILVTALFIGGLEASLAVLYALMSASIVSIILLAVKRGSKNTKLPFMPFLLLGCILERTGVMI